MSIPALCADDSLRFLNHWDPCALKNGFVVSWARSRGERGCKCAYPKLHTICGQGGPDLWTRRLTTNQNQNQMNRIRECSVMDCPFTHTRTSVSFPFLKDSFTSIRMEIKAVWFESRHNFIPGSVYLYYGGRKAWMQLPTRGKAYICIPRHFQEEVKCSSPVLP